MRTLMLICLTPFLMSCASTITRTAIPKELLVPCDKPTYEWVKTEDIVREADERGLAIDKCNAIKKAYGGVK